MKTLDHCIKTRIELVDKFLLTYPDLKFKIQPIFETKIIFNDRMRSTIGKVNYKDNSLFLNTRLLELYPNQFDDTFAHELAHLISFFCFNRSGHGRYWKLVMRTLGFNPAITHNLDVSTLKRSHPVVCLAKCGCRQDIKIKPRRFKRIQDGVSYQCNRCKINLEIVK